MSRFLISVLSSVTLLFAATASAQSTQAPVIVQGESNAKKVCKSEPVVGSRFVKKTCHTPAEWQASRPRCSARSAAARLALQKAKAKAATIITMSKVGIRLMWRRLSSQASSFQQASSHRIVQTEQPAQ